MAPVLNLVVPLLALAVLLGAAYMHLRPRTEALVAVAAGAAVLATGSLGRTDLNRERDHLLPVVLFLIAILVVAECCRAAGLFAAIGSRLAAGGRPRLMFAATFAVAAATTVVLSLDATVVLVTPVVMASAAASALSPRPFQLICVRLANSASLLLPVANLTNLLAMPDLDLSIGRFALLMAPVWLLVLGVEYVVHRIWFRDELAASPRAARGAPLPLPRFPLVVVAVMLGGFAAGSWVGPAWVAGGAALVLVLRGLLTGDVTVGQAVRAGQPGFALFVLSLGLVVAALGEGVFGDALAHVVPNDHGLVALLGVAAVGAVLANLVNNLPATLLLVPLVAGLGPVAVLATLIGINLGSSMTWAGSLANLLWRRTVRAEGGVADSRDFHLVGLLATPVSIVAGVVVLHLWSQLV
ncbi:MAG: SLC13 family permease [Propionibacteriales bacterium]|nr:SLC13 family permease [Propionibacteriales bacterium]